MPIRKVIRRVHRAEKPGPPPRPKISTLQSAVLNAIAAANIHSPLPGEALDIGSGNGELISAIRARFGLRTSACDYTDTLMKDSAQRVDVVDLNIDKLPYLDGRFCLVTCIETLAHLEQTRVVLREIFRVLEPGGVTVISAPNILNLPSRLRYLTTGFFSHCQPLPIRERGSPRGRVNPIGYFYLAHALLEAGFLDLEPEVDCFERRSWLWWIILFLPMKVVGLFFWLREKNKFGTVTPETRALVAAVNSRDLLLGRSLIVCARKPT